MPCTLDWFPGEVTDGARFVGLGAVTDHVNATEPESTGLPLSVTVTVTVLDPTVVGVPVTTPVDAFSARPAGNPDAAYPNV